jgi:lipoprotein-releasing system ATP-binding protein
MSIILKAENLSKSLEGEIPVTLINNVNIEINSGEFVAITGLSGSGKSSLLYLLGLLDKPSHGNILLEGKDVFKYDDKILADIRLSKIGFIFQFHFLLPEFTALENVCLPMEQLGKLSSSEIIRKSKEILASLELEQHMHKLPNQLSGGQSQRVAIARALANDPLLVLADEPTGNLDSASSKNVQKILRNVATQNGRTVIVVTHDAGFANLADKIIHIIDGKIIS